MQLPRIQSDASFPTRNPCLPWCGVLVDTVTFEFYGDYSRYKGEFMSESLTVSYHSHPGKALRQKIKQFAQPKCIPLLLDSRINSLHVIRINVYHIFLLCAIKFHCFVKCLPRRENQRFLFDVIVDVIEYADALIQSRIKALNDASSVYLPPRHVRFLGQHAFWTILKRRSAYYPDIVRTLTHKFAKDVYLHGLLEEFRGTTDPKISKLFLECILF